MLNISWIITNQCNYDCPYCFIYKSLKKEKPNLNLENALLFFNSIEPSYITISGGEPFIIKDFIEFIKNLKKDHKITIFTNLSTANIYEFADKINPKKIERIRTSLHLTELKNNNKINEFIKKYHYLRKKGFFIDCSVVMFPPIFKKFNYIYNFFKNQEIFIIPVVFIGKYKNKIFPESYTKREIKLIDKYFDETNKKIFNNNYKNPNETAKKIISYQGKNCSAGSIYFIIDYQGNIKRCSSDNEIIANINDNPKIILKKPYPCKNNLCLCPGEGIIHCEQFNKKKIKSITQ